MKWSEDGSEITLSASEFAEQVAALAVAKAKADEARAYAERCNDILNEALKKDATLRYLNDVKSSCERKSIAEREVISAARHFFADLMNAFHGSKHPEDCPCCVCNVSKVRKSLDKGAALLYFDKPPSFAPVAHIPAHVEENEAKDKSWT
jgi:hypothetical protein